MLLSLAAVGPASADSDPRFVGSYSRLTITFGQSWRVWGEVDTADGVPASDGVVNLGRKVYGHDWELFRTDASAAGFDFTATPKKRTSYQLCYIGTDSPATDPVCTTVMTVKVRRKLSMPTVRSRARALTGHVRPGYQHHKVIVQKRRCATCRWRTHQVVRTGAHSGWRVHIPVRRMRYRAVVPASKGYARSVSRPQLVVVR